MKYEYRNFHRPQPSENQIVDRTLPEPKSGRSGEIALLLVLLGLVSASVVVFLR